jgi:hypothetical protein
LRTDQSVAGGDLAPGGDEKESPGGKDPGVDDADLKRPSPQPLSGSTVFDPEAQTRRELIEVQRTGRRRRSKSGPDTAHDGKTAENSPIRRCDQKLAGGSVGRDSYFQ